MSDADRNLKTLLQAADRAASLPRVRADLAERVRASAIAAPVSAMRGAAVAAAVMLAFAWLWSAPRLPSIVDVVTPTPRAAQVVNVEDQLREIERLRRIANQRESVLLRGLELQSQRTRFNAARLAAHRANAVDREANSEFDVIAEGLVLIAQRQMDEGFDAAAAVRFERVVRSFPETAWAQVARIRLDELEQRSASQPARRDS